jgi:hypothetical protein
MDHKPFFKELCSVALAPSNRQKEKGTIRQEIVILTILSIILEKKTSFLNLEKGNEFNHFVVMKTEVCAYKADHVQQFK